MTDQKITISDADISAAKPSPRPEPKGIQQPSTHEPYQPTSLPQKEDGLSWLRFFVLLNFFLTLMLLGIMIFFAWNMAAPTPPPMPTQETKKATPQQTEPVPSNPLEKPPETPPPPKVEETEKVTPLEKEPVPSTPSETLPETLPPPTVEKTESVVVTGKELKVIPQNSN